MLDISLIRNNKEFVKNELSKRSLSYKELVDKVFELDLEWRALKKELDSFRAKKNEISKQISKTKDEELILRSKEIGKKIKELEKKEKELLEKRDLLLLELPNIPSPSCPIGEGEEENRVVFEVKPKKLSAIPHYELGVEEGVLDFERGSLISGHRFVVMRKWLVKLNRALINFMLDFASSHGYEEVWVPHLVRSSSLIGTGQLPKFKEDLYRTQDDLWLIPTAEVPLVNLVRDSFIEEKDLPLRFSSFTPCYRREAGAYGRDIKGIIRQHQFDKVELVSITSPEESYKELERKRGIVEELLKRLELPYRVVELCTGDLPFSSAKTYDLEVWIPSQKKYREISSISNCTDFQARRIKARIRRGNELIYPHTLNGSSLALGRTLVAIMENFQEEDGIALPRALWDYSKTEFIEFKRTSK